MTPILVLLFRVPPLAAVGSDLVASLFMKPVGAAVHWRRGTVEKGVVVWLLLGSVPAAFSGVLLVRLTGHGQALETRVQLLLGAVLLLACAGIVAKTWFESRRRAPYGRAGETTVRVRRSPTIIVGAVGGLIVGMTSVGSGSLVIALLMLVYPALSSRRLVGTDLAQAVPMVSAAALGHYLFGEFRLNITLAILLGAIPGVYLGSRFSSASPDFIIRPLLFFVLFASAVKLLGASNQQALGPLAIGAALAALVAYLTTRGRQQLVTTPAGEVAAA